MYTKDDHSISNSVKHVSIPSIHLDTNACPVRHAVEGGGWFDALLEPVRETSTSRLWIQVSRFLSEIPFLRFLVLFSPGTSAHETIARRNNDDAIDVRIIIRIKVGGKIWYIFFKVTNNRRVKEKHQYKSLDRFHKIIKWKFLFKIIYENNCRRSKIAIEIEITLIYFQNFWEWILKDKHKNNQYKNINRDSFITTTED